MYIDDSSELDHIRLRWMVQIMLDHRSGGSLVAASLNWKFVLIAAVISESVETLTALSSRGKLE